jgi:hypothetical protein
VLGQAAFGRLDLHLQAGALILQVFQKLALGVLGLDLGRGVRAQDPGDGPHGAHHGQAHQAVALQAEGQGEGEEAVHEKGDDAGPGGGPGKGRQRRHAEQEAQAERIVETTDQEERRQEQRQAGVLQVGAGAGILDHGLGCLKKDWSLIFTSETRFRLRRTKDALRRCLVPNFKAFAWALALASGRPLALSRPTRTGKGASTRIT